MGHYGLEKKFSDAERRSNLSSNRYHSFFEIPSDGKAIVFGSNTQLLNKRSSTDSELAALGNFMGKIM